MTKQLYFLALSNEIHILKKLMQKVKLTFKWYFFQNLFSFFLEIKNFVTNES